MEETACADVERATKKVRAAGIYEVRVEMLMVAERVGIWYIPKLLNTYMRDGKIKKTQRKGALFMCYPGIHVWPRDDGNDRETTREGAGL